MKTQSTRHRWHAHFRQSRMLKRHPVVQAPHLAAMEATGAVKTVLKNTFLPLMGSGAGQTGGGQGRMDAVPTHPSTPSSPSGKPQQPKEGAQVQTPGEGYVRLEVHVDNGKLSIISAKPVPGPLAMPSAVIHGYAYEVILNDQQVALGRCRTWVCGGRSRTGMFRIHRVNTS